MREPIIILVLPSSDLVLQSAGEILENYEQFLRSFFLDISMSLDAYYVGVVNYFL